MAVTVVTTWYFTRRYYVKESGPPTDLDLAMQDNKLRFWMVVIVIGGATVMFPLLIMVLAPSGS